VTLEHVTKFGDDWPRDLSDRRREKRSRGAFHKWPSPSRM